MTRRGLAIGCGGTLGFAWTAIALQAVERELGWDARTAEVLVGTSAGSEMVALLGSGRSVAEIAADLGSPAPGIRPPLPRLSWPALGSPSPAAHEESAVPPRWRTRPGAPAS